MSYVVLPVILVFHTRKNWNRDLYHVKNCFWSGNSE